MFRFERKFVGAFEIFQVQALGVRCQPELQRACLGHVPVDGGVNVQSVLPRGGGITRAIVG